MPLGVKNKEPASANRNDSQRNLLIYKKVEMENLSAKRTCREKVSKIEAGSLLLIL